jgi:hypothetical protein
LYLSRCRFDDDTGYLRPDRKDGALNADHWPARRYSPLLVAALDGTGDLRLLADLAPGPEALAPAERLGLVDVDDQNATPRLHHPVIRAAIVAARSRAWHLDEAATDPDEQFAALLHASARVNLRYGDPRRRSTSCCGPPS